MAQTLASASASASTSTSTSTSTSSTASSHGNYSYHVFINHRGSDVKKTFASHLYRRLLSYGFRVFLDQQELQRGEAIDCQIESAIATASVHVAILSSRYAQSSWCLDELVLMLKSMESGAATVIPVFYNVKPSALRWTDTGKNSDRLCGEALRILRQTGRYRVFVYALRILRRTGKDSVYVEALKNISWTSSDRVYAEALLNHEKKGRYSQERLAAWRKALSDVSHISGFELEACNGDEGQLVDEVVRQVQKKVGKAPLHVATHPTGLDEKLQHFEKTVLWEKQHNRGGPNIVGIVGLGGLGKTTLAKFFFNTKRSDYQQSCFLHDVRDAAARCRLPSLQSELYKDLIEEKQVMHNVDEGIATLKDRSCGQSLVVLDDVDDAEQLGALFSPLKDVLPSDSLILITSRNRDVLRKCARIEESSIYMMTGLDLEYSEQLFCSYAFNHPYPAVGYEDLVGKFLKACQGLPLSLKVIGALLYSERREYWEDQLSKLSQVLPTEIQSRLKISYDSLEKQEKEIFLDISCFFIGINRDTAIILWDGSGWNGSLGLRVLESKCLVTLDEKNCIRMHDHLRDLGRELAELPGCTRRLWRPSDSLFRNVPTPSTVRGLTMIQQGSGESSQSPLEFKDRMVDMTGLQLLRAPADCLERIFKLMRHPELLWLRSNIDPFRSLPSWIQRNSSDFCLPSWIPIKNLRVLELEWEWRLPEGNPVLGTLWNTESEAPLQLRELKISCGLLELPKSIGQLKYLQKIELHHFRGTLPEEFFHLCSLKHLRLVASMESLPDSLENFTNLQHIDLSHCRNLQTLPPSFGNLAMLQHIDLSWCWKLQTLPASIGNLKQVQYIKLSGCQSLQRLPDSMNLIRLKELKLFQCRNLVLTGQTLENVSTLERLDFSGCRKMEILPSQVTRQQFLEELILEDTNLKELPNAIGDLSNLENLAISSPSLETLPHSLGKLTKLKKLRVWSGELKYFTDLVGELKPLASLFINSSIREKVDGGRRLMDPSIDKCMLRLKSLDLSKTRITEITFGEGVCPDLEYLNLIDCDELVEVGALPTTLTSLILSKCRALKKVRRLRGLAKLRDLYMKGCKEIENLPDVRELDNLIVLNLEECPMGGVMPFASIEKVQGGLRLDSSSIDKCMPRLQWLILSKTRITEISFGGGVCPVLEHLDLSGCADLVEIGALPTTLTVLHLQDCCALKKISGLRGLAKLESLYMEGCCAVEELPGLETLISLKSMRTSECENMKRIVELTEAANPESDVLKKVIQLIQRSWRGQ